MKTRYPIVLVHGLGMKDTFFMRSFGRIDRLLRVQGYEVYKSRVDGMGTVAGNAAQLKREIDEILRRAHAEKVNIIAHSKGGLDAKYMIRRLGMAGRVASLTTLCTPHRGSPIASFVLRFPRFLLRIAAFFVNAFYRLLGDRAPDSLTACEELRRVERVDQETLNVSGGVFCQSFSSAVRKGAAPGLRDGHPPHVLPLSRKKRRDGRPRAAGLRRLRSLPRRMRRRFRLPHRDRGFHGFRPQARQDLRLLVGPVRGIGEIGFLILLAHKNGRRKNVRPFFFISQSAHN
ncbi:MAG: hypothetical protein IJS53_03885 [Clostridia bacterium]|nr:hypothetical protein [Clostridia bacterium]